MTAVRRAGGICLEGTGELSHKKAVTPPPLSLLFVIGTYHPVVGGGEKHAQGLAEELVRRGHRVRVLTRRTSANLPRRECLNGVEVERLGPSGFPRLGKYLLLPAACLKVLCLRREYDVLQVCAFRVLGWVGVFASRISGKPVVLRAEACGEWSGDFIRGKKGPLLRAYLALRNHAFLGCDSFLSISSVVRNEFLHGGIPTGRILDITNGIDFSPYRPAAGPEEKRGLRRQWGWPEGAPLWASTGKLIRGKGMDRLIRVLARLRPSHPDLRLVLIGSGAGQSLNVEPELRELSRTLGVADRVIFTGYSTRVGDMLRACDGFVFASDAESLGLAAVEAMATGLPVLLSDVGGLKEVLPDGVEAGSRLPPGEEAAWERAWDALLRQDPDQLRALGARGRATVLARYDIREVAAATEAAFRSVLARRSPASRVPGPGFPPPAG